MNKQLPLVEIYFHQHYCREGPNPFSNPTSANKLNSKDNFRAKTKTMDFPNDYHNSLERKKFQKN